MFVFMSVLEWGVFMLVSEIQVNTTPCSVHFSLSSQCVGTRMDHNAMFDKYKLGCALMQVVCYAVCKYAVCSMQNAVCSVCKYASIQVCSMQCVQCVQVCRCCFRGGLSKQENLPTHVVRVNTDDNGDAGQDENDGEN